MKPAKKHSHIDLATGPVHQHLIRMALPLTFGIFSTMAFVMVDMYFIGKLGADELAAMGFVSRVAMVLFAVSIGIGAGTSSVLARAVGKKNPEEIRILASNSFVLALLLSILAGIIGLLTIDPLFRLIGADETTLPLIREYITIWYFGLPFVIVPMVGMSGMRAMGDSKLQSRIMVLAALGNAALDPIFIFGLFGFPRLELAGAALATLIVRFATFTAIAAYLYYRYEILSFSRSVLIHFKTATRQVLHVGLPAMGTNMIIPLAGLVVVSIIAKYGQHEVGATGVAISLESVMMIVFYALSSVIGPFVGQNLGARHYDRIIHAIKITSIFCLGWGVVLAILAALFSPYLAELFSTKPDVINIIVSYLLIVPVSYGAYGIVMMANAIYNGIGKPLPGVFLSTFRTVVLQLPLVLLAAYYFDIKAVFACIAVSNLITGVLAYFWVMRTARQLE